MQYGSEVGEQGEWLTKYHQFLTILKTKTTTKIIVSISFLNLKGISQVVN